MMKVVDDIHVIVMMVIMMIFYLLFGYYFGRRLDNNLFERFEPGAFTSSTTTPENM